VRRRPLDADELADADAVASEKVARGFDFDGTADDSAVVLAVRDDGDRKLIVELRASRALERLPGRTIWVLSRSCDAFVIGNSFLAHRLCVSKFVGIGNGFR